MSRSLGDAMAKRCGVISTPSVRIIPRDRTRDRAILVCSDGISDQISAREMEDTVSHFYRSQDTESCCKLLVESATEKWHNKHNMQDDITAIIIFMR
jgi:serine/threonine protein phosphatase PrpC